MPENAHPKIRCMTCITACAYRHVSHFWVPICTLCTSSFSCFSGQPMFGSLGSCLFSLTHKRGPGSRAHVTYSSLWSRNSSVIISSLRLSSLEAGLRMVFWDSRAPLLLQIKEKQDFWSTDHKYVTRKLSGTDTTEARKHKYKTASRISVDVY